MHIYVQLPWDLSHSASLNFHFSWLYKDLDVVIPGHSIDLEKQRNCQTVDKVPCPISHAHHQGARFQFPWLLLIVAILEGVKQ